MKFLLEDSGYYSKYDEPEKILKSFGKHFYHAINKKYLKDIYENGLENFWFGNDENECIEYAVMNHDGWEYEDIVVLELSTKLLDPLKCDFTEDAGDGWSEVWTGTGVYRGLVSVKTADCYFVDDDLWYYAKDLDFNKETFGRTYV